MWQKRDLRTLTPVSASALTIGAFDGVHRGHQALIRQLVHEAHTAGLQALVLTFDPLPRQVLGNAESTLLSELDERLAYFEALGVDGVIVQPFDREVAAISAHDFVELLVTRAHMRSLWIGPDFTLGRAQEGDAAFLQRAAERRGFTVHLVEQPFLWEGKPVRSTRIRQALLAGDLVEANALLGRPYQVRGTIIHGQKRGRTLGFPTANLEIPPERLVPAGGIYVCRAHLSRGSFGAVTNIGTRPTFNHSEVTVEAHLLEFSADIYGERLQLDFLARLRPECKFTSAQELVAQMNRDIAQAQAWFAQENTIPQRINVALPRRG